MSDSNLYRILAFGDSLTEGYVNDQKCQPYTLRLSKLLSERFPDTAFQVDNKGIYGELVYGQMTVRLSEVLKECGPYNLVIILGGTNDICEAKEGMENSLFEGIKSLHATVRTHGAKSIVVTIPETDVNYKDLGRNGLSWVKERGESIRLVVNEKLREYVKECGDNVTLCDLAVKLPQQSMNAEDLDKFWRDGIHFTEDGYNKMAEIIFEEIKCINIAPKLRN